MTDALKNFTRGMDNTPQTQPIPGSNQVKNSAGGYTWQIDDEARLLRFLVLGSDGGTYYASESQLTQENAEAVARCLKSDAVRTIQKIVEVSEAGRAPSNDYALFALAMASSPRFNESSVARKMALEVLPRVARTGTHLFHFCDYVQGFRGWGRGLREAVANWYEDKPADKLAYQAIKYRQRDGWSHRDVLRKAHPQGAKRDHSYIYQWITDRDSAVGQTMIWENRDALTHIAGFEAAQVAKTEKQLIAVLGEYPNLPHEALPTELKNKPGVAMALLENGMPYGALIRQLATHTRAGILDPGSEGERIVLDQLANEEALRKSRLHPIKALSAYLVYGGDVGDAYSSYGFRGKPVENPNPRIIDALEETFYAAFGNVEPTGKTHLLALDVSGSMSWGEIARVPGLTPALGAAVMAMVTARSGDPYMIYGFSTTFKNLGITAKQDLRTVLQKTRDNNFGGTDCSLPMKWAQKNAKTVDMFVVYTDNETWAGRGHPSQALDQYRKAYNHAARMAVVGMTATDFSIADPADAGQLDVVGFDTATPNILADFAKGLI